MRLSRAIDKFLGQMQVERDWTARSVKSYADALHSLADQHPDAQVGDFDGRRGLELVRDHIAHRYGHLTATTRATRISYLHSFFAWAEAEGLLEDDQVRRIKRPPKRRPDIYRPSPTELLLGESVTTLDERAAWALMSRRGFRAATVCALRWQDFDLQRGRVRVQVKGGHRDIVPLGAALTEVLQDVFREIQPDPDHHVFTVQRELYVDSERRIRTTRDPRTPASTKALWGMVQRVCKRAGIRPLGPHALRHGFATDFLRASDRDVVSLQKLLGHSRIDTTKLYVDELDLEELDDALDRATERRAVARSGDVTSVASTGDGSTLHLGLSRNRADGGGGNRTRVPDGSAVDAEQDRTRSTDEPRPTGSLTSHKQAGLGAGDDPTPAGGRRAPVDRGQEA